MVDRDSAREEPAAKGKSALSGIRKLLLPHPDARSAVSALARALFAPIRKGPGAETRQDLVKFLGRVALFGDLRKGELKRLARVVHKRRYADGESILEQGRPGAALFIVRSGVVEIFRRSRSGEEVPLVVLEPPASFEELAAMADAIRWVSARARGPVTLLALGRSDLDALSRNFPTLANKILRQLVQVVSARVQLLLERDFPAAQDGEPES
jgi:CRP/FNR family cyclic AMP-dependent transcriptional regulator